MKELNAKYIPSLVEEGKYDKWVKEGYFEAGDISKKPYTIVIPPPNVTGKLHLGHAWDTSIQDMIIRRKRMQGYDALWLPGMDHAGIATQAKVEERLRAQNISRYDLGRENFLKQAWAWKEEYAEIIRSQWKALGLSLDYTKERFTLDEGLNKAVNYVFIKLYEKGYLYQGERIINWDSQAKTALSNIEVEHIEIEGAFYHFVYPFCDSEGGLIVATTRPETMFADQAIMVHPEDERYKQYINKFVFIPGTDIKIPVIADSYVDMEFGTGCVKVTPAHDPNDFEVGKRHNLDMPLCMNADGTMNEMSLKYCGLDRFVCRKQLVSDLEEIGLLHKIEKIMHSVGHSERTGVVVEPRLSKQWFVKMDVLAQQVLDNDEFKFVPERFKTNLNRWLENIQDWCISRQLWWGHRIPAWYKGEEVVVSETSPGEGYVQDEDVLDTWFSSALWPFSTLGWPEKTDLLQRYYPTDVLVTGYDIIFFWVSRMLFEGIEFTKQAPFKDILIHGLIRDKEGRKMSKSLGNGVDPFDVIAKHGTDALRYFLNTNSSPGMDLRFDETKIESAWNYINKLWNISRYVMMNLDNSDMSIDISKLNFHSKYILSRLNKVISEVDFNYDKYEFGEAARSIYNFVWDDFASWYIELSKVDLQSDDEANKTNTQAVLVYVLKTILKLLHPYIPFVTEEIYTALVDDENTITTAMWPIINPDFNFGSDEDFMEIMKELITSVRNERAKANKAPSHKVNATLEVRDEVIYNKMLLFTPYLEKFLNTSNLVITCDSLDKEDMVVVVLNALNVYIPTSDLIDIKEVLESLEKEKEKLTNELKRSNNMLANEAFVKKAPAAKIEAEKEKLQNYQNRYNEVVEQINAIKNK